MAVHIRRVFSDKSPWLTFPTQFGTFDRPSGARNARTRDLGTICLFGYGPFPLCCWVCLGTHNRHGLGVGFSRRHASLSTDRDKFDPFGASVAEHEDERPKAVFTLVTRGRFLDVGVKI